MKTHTKLSTWASDRPSLKMNKNTSMLKWDSLSGKITISLIRIFKTEASHHMERRYHQKLRVKTRTSDILKLRNILNNSNMTTITRTRNLFTIMGKGMIKMQGTIKTRLTIRMRRTTKMLNTTKIQLKKKLTIRTQNTISTQHMTKMLSMIKM